MNVDAYTLFWACVRYLFIGIALGSFITWTMMTGDPAVIAWVAYHIPWLYSLIHTGFVCPNGYQCTKP